MGTEKGILRRESAQWRGRGHGGSRRGSWRENRRRVRGGTGKEETETERETETETETETEMKEGLEGGEGEGGGHGRMEKEGVTGDALLEGEEVSVCVPVCGCVLGLR